MKKSKEKLGIGNLTNLSDGLNIVRHQKGCVFRMMYSLRSDQLFAGRNASKMRIQLGERLALESPCNADLVTAIPESGLFPATGYAGTLGIPFHFGIIRDYITPRTLIHNISKRKEYLDNKLIILPEVLKDKNIVLIDEAIISGNTMEIVVEKIRESGAKSIHIKIPSPIMFNKCTYKILRSDAFLLSRHLLEEVSDISLVEEAMKDYFGVDSLKFVSLEGFLDQLKEMGFSCTNCFNLPN